MNTQGGSGAVSVRQSLRVRLPLVISSLIAVVLLTFLWAAYRTVETTLLRAGGERAQAAADQVAGLLHGQASLDQLGRVTSDADVRNYLHTRSGEDLEAARKRLAVLASPAPRRVELWDDAGSRLLEISVPAVTAGPGAARNPLPPITGPSMPGISRLQASGDLVFTDVVVELRDEQPATAQMPKAGRLGYLIIRSTFAVNPPGIISRLVGQDASVAIGNATGGVWTDFANVVAAPGVDLTRAGVSEYTRPGGELRLGALRPIGATPWVAWVEFPHARLVAPARLFLTGMIVVAIAVVTGGAMLATTVAARITNPLSELNTAAEAVALGDYSRRVHATRRDEIGRLGRTFNAMAGQLATSEASYRLLFQSTPHAMWVYDVDTLRFLDVNDMAIAQYGYSCDEFLAMTIKDIRPPSAVPQLLENISQTSEAVGLSGVWTHRKKDGTLIEVEISSHAIVLHGHRARSVIAHDVTERLKAQQALRQSEELFRGMAETMPQIVWTARPDGWRDYYNRQWFEYTGSTLEEAQGWGWAAALHPDDRLRTVALWRTAIETGAAGYEISHRIKRATDGQYRWHIGRAAPLRNEAGQIVLWVGTNTDVDDAKRADDELQSLNAELEQRVQIRTAQLEEANHELESFSYSVSHDLRAPLRHVQGYVEMLTAAARAQLSEKSLRYLKTISDATVEMGQLIDDLLAFSRIARVQMYEGAVPLDGLIEDVIQGLEMATKGRHIIWKIAALPTAVGDRAMLKQVYANLVGNAVKYTRQRDPAEIEIGCAGEQDGRCVLFVRDNGAGFDMQYAHKLFGVFQRLHRAEEFEGTGIGLATVRRIVVRHGGTAWAEGKLNEGATVYFTLEVTTACSQTADQQR